MRWLPPSPLVKPIKGYLVQTLLLCRDRPPGRSFSRKPIVGRGFTPTAPVGAGLLPCVILSEAEGSVSTEKRSSEKLSAERFCIRI